VNKALTVAWINDFPVEWLPVVPAQLARSPKRHPATWAMVLLEEFQKDPSLKIHVIVLRHRIDRSFSFEQNNAVFHVLKATPWARVASVFWLDTLRIRRLCQRIQPDLVHAWGMEKAGGLVAHRLPYPYLLTIQGLYGWYRENTPLRGYDRFIERLDRYALPRAPLVTTESRFAVQFLKQRYPRLRVHQAEHAPNQAFFRVQRQPQTRPLRLISIGGLEHRKGTDLLFLALDRLSATRDLKLTIISGPNPAYLPALKAMVSPQFVGRVEFKHHLLPHEVARELAQPAMLLLPTRADTSPNAVKEAAVAGVPVVATNVGGIPDYITSGKNGFLAPPNSLEGFVQALHDACAHPLFSEGKVEATVLGAVRDYLSPERMAVNFRQAYDAALGLQRLAAR